MVYFTDFYNHTISIIYCSNWSFCVRLNQYLQALPIRKKISLLVPSSPLSFTIFFLHFGPLYSSSICCCRCCCCWWWLSMCTHAHTVVRKRRKKKRKRKRHKELRIIIPGHRFIAIIAYSFSTLFVHARTHTLIKIMMVVHLNVCNIVVIFSRLFLNNPFIK